MFLKEEINNILSDSILKEFIRDMDCSCDKAKFKEESKCGGLLSGIKKQSHTF